MIIKGKDYIVETLELSNEDCNFIKICYDYSQRYPFKWNYLKKDIFTNEEIIYFKDTTMIISIDSIKLEKLLTLFDFLKSLLNYRIIKKIIQKKEFVIAHFSETFQMEYIQRLDFLESISLYRKLLKELKKEVYFGVKLFYDNKEYLISILAHYHNKWFIFDASRKIEYSLDNSIEVVQTIYQLNKIHLHSRIKTKLMIQYAETNYENALWNILNCTS